MAKKAAAKPAEKTPAKRGPGRPKKAAAVPAPTPIKHKKVSEASVVKAYVAALKGMSVEGVTAAEVSAGFRLSRKSGNDPRYGIEVIVTVVAYDEGVRAANPDTLGRNFSVTSRQY